MIHSLIVGYGLAGFHYSRVLQKQDKDFVVFSDQRPGASSNAGGVFNPTILKRFTLAWNALEFFEYAQLCYLDFEKEFGTSIFDKQPIIYSFSDVVDQNNWVVAAHTQGLNRFMEAEFIQTSVEGIKENAGYAQLKNVGKVHIQKMLKVYRERVLKNQFYNEAFEYDKLKFMENGIEYKGIQAERIVFCEGYGLKANPWFSYLPLTGSKGEFLHIRSRELSQKRIIKGKGIFIVPMGEDVFWVGATFSRDDKSTLPTSQGKEWLMNKLNSMIHSGYEVMEHRAALRPTVQDRRPLLGRHPKKEQLYVLNGLGTRGLLMGPLLAHWLLQYIDNDLALPPSVTIDRFESYLNKQSSTI